MRHLLDASAVLAHMYGEPLAPEVDAARGEGCFIASINLAEVCRRLGRDGHEEVARSVADQFNAAIVPLTEEIALRAGELAHAFRRYGLSLADACCLATAESFDAVALTTDHAWTKLPRTWSGRVRLVRP
jgi:PIN domain nuclease of toxin-antitoxin system